MSLARLVLCRQYNPMVQCVTTDGYAADASHHRMHCLQRLKLVVSWLVLSYVNRTPFQLMAFVFCRQGILWCAALVASLTVMTHRTRGSKWSSAGLC